jgi:hypothetical protein
MYKVLNPGTNTIVTKILQHTTITTLDHFTLYYLFNKMLYFIIFLTF